MSIVPKKNSSRATKSAQCERDLPPHDVQGGTNANEDNTELSRPFKKHAPTPPEDNTNAVRPALDCGLPLVTFLNTQPWLRASSCGKAHQQRSHSSATANDSAARARVGADHSCCLACGHLPSIFVSRPRAEGTNVPDNRHGRSENVRLPGAISFITFTTPKSPLVFAYDPTISHEAPPSSSNFTYESCTFTSFSAVLAVDGNDFRLAVGPEPCADGVGESKLRNGGTSTERKCEKGNSKSGVFNRSERRNKTLWNYCFTFSCNVAKMRPRLVVKKNVTSLELMLPLLTLVFYTTSGATSDDSGRMSALVAAICEIGSSPYENNRIGDDFDTPGRSIDKNSETNDKGCGTVAKKQSTSKSGLSSVLGDFIQEGVGLVMPPQMTNTSVYGSSDLLTRFAKSAAATDHALSVAVEKAEDWTRFALNQPSSGSAGGVISVEQFRERRKAFRALYPSR